jgi:hypothetical protein
MKKTKQKPNHTLEPMEPRLLFSAGLEGVLAADALTTTTASLSPELIQQLSTEAPVTSDVQSDADISHELVFIDTDTPDYEQLVEDLLADQDESRRIGIVLLDNNRDGIEQITDILSKFENLDAVHIISHGGDGTIDLGGSTLDGESLEANAERITGWSKSFSESGDLLIYGCDLAATENGQSLIDNLATLTGADVAASDDLTGNAQLGGDWELEYRTGAIETELAVSTQAQTAFEAVLVTETVRDEFNAVSYSNNDGTATWTGGWVEEGETTDPTKGRILITSDQLEISGPIVGNAIYREVDLSGAAAATLSLDRNNLLTGSNTVTLSISDNGGSSWTTLFDYKNNNGSGAGSDSYDISAFTSATTQIRFEFTAGNSSDIMYVDNVEISYHLPGPNPPVITSDGGGATASVNVAENTTAVTTVTASDPDVGDVPTFSISGGTDAALFSINSTTGELTFNTAPDYETPTDANTDNVYEVTVEASDGTNIDTQAISVTVTDVLDNNTAPVISGANDLTAIDEDPVSNPGTLVSDLIAGQVTDADAGALSGIAVIGVDDTNGTWEYTTDGGSNWFAFGAVDSTSARLLAADANTYVRFVPNADWNGTVTNGITFHAWDQTSGTAGSTADLTSNTVRDEFSTATYSNNDGTAAWTGNWTETGDDGSASTGNLRIESGELFLFTSVSITRTFDLSSASSGTLTFDYSGYAYSGTDNFAMSVSDNGGSTWVQLEEISFVSSPGETWWCASRSLPASRVRASMSISTMYRLPTQAVAGQAGRRPSARQPPAAASPSTASTTPPNWTPARPTCG